MNKDNSTPIEQSSIEVNKANESWEGLTLEQLRMRRAIALVHREIGRAQLAKNVSQARGQVATNGVRGLLFSKETITKLKTADYLLLGWKLARSIIKYRNRNR